MWTIVDIAATDLLSHDLPCFRCGHAIHTYLPCSDTCACEPAEMPGEPPLRWAGLREVVTAA